MSAKGSKLQEALEEKWHFSSKNKVLIRQKLSSHPYPEFSESSQNPKTLIDHEITLKIFEFILISIEKVKLVFLLSSMCMFPEFKWTIRGSFVWFPCLLPELWSLNFKKMWPFCNILLISPKNL